MNERSPKDSAFNKLMADELLSRNAGKAVEPDANSSALVPQIEKVDMVAS